MKNNVLANISDNLKLESIIGQKGVGFTNAIIVSDTLAPSIVLPAVRATHNFADGSYSVVLNYNLTTSYQCYYQVLIGTSAPSATGIKTCTSTTNCGSFILSTTPTTISNKSQPSFSIGSEYTIWAVCYNRIPNAQLASNILNLYYFKPVCLNGQTVSNSTCIIPSTSSSTSNTPLISISFSSYILISFSTILAVIFLIFN